MSSGAVWEAFFRREVTVSVRGGAVVVSQSVSYGEWGDVDCRFPRA